MNAVVLAVKASYVASTKYTRAGPGVSICLCPLILISTICFLFPVYRQGAVTSVNFYLLSLSTCNHLVGQVVFGMWSKIDIPSTAVSRRSNRLALLDSELGLQTRRQLRIMLMSLTTCCPTRWHRQHWLESNRKWCCRPVYRLLRLVAGLSDVLGGLAFMLPFFHSFSNTSLQVFPELVQ